MLLIRLRATENKVNYNCVFEAVKEGVEGYVSEIVANTLRANKIKPREGEEYLLIEDSNDLENVAVWRVQITATIPDPIYSVQYDDHTPVAI